MELAFFVEDAGRSITCVRWNLIAVNDLHFIATGDLDSREGIQSSTPLIQSDRDCVQPDSRSILNSPDCVRLKESDGRRTQAACPDRRKASHRYPLNRPDGMSSTEDSIGGLNS
jgi:hypothetical protein